MYRDHLFESPVAEFIDPWLGDKVNPGTPGLQGGLAGTTTLYVGVDFISQSGIYEFGHSIPDF
jgi:hypothetical protein